jgi:DNA-binding LacI/PurR family transcriptional regulator
MDLVPQRNSLLSATTAILRDAIQDGEWNSILPGERKLCERMQVGRDTLRLALKQVEREGLIGKSNPGKQRPILWKSKKQHKGKSRLGVIVYLTPHGHERLSETALTEIDCLRSQLTDSSFRLELITSSVFGMKRPSISLQKLITEHGADAWILHKSTQPMQQWFQDNRIPCLLHGQPQKGIELPFVDLDYVAIGRHAGGYLAGRGHRRIALLRPASGLRGLELAESGLRESLATSTGGGEFSLLVVRERDTLDALQRQINLLMRIENPPTALVVTRSRHVLSVITHLAQLGKKVPDDLSLMALDYEPYLDHLFPKITSYRVDMFHTARMLVRKVLELAGSGSTTRSAQALMPDFSAGGTVAKLTSKSSR